MPSSKNSSKASSVTKETPRPAPKGKEIERKEETRKEDPKKAASPDKSNPTSVTIRHPLQHRWALWYLKADRNKEWEDCLKQVSLFDTVEDFWALMNHIQTATGLNWGSDYYLFKEGIKPMWEDDHNVRGGRWLVVVDKQKRHQLLDRYWQELLMAIVGEQFEDMGEHICGAVVNVRQKGDKVSLWTGDSTADDVNTRIGYILKAKLRLPEAEPLRYEVHKDSSARTSSMVKPRILLQAKKEKAEQKAAAAAAAAQTTEPKKAENPVVPAAADADPAGE